MRAQSPSRTTSLVVLKNGRRLEYASTEQGHYAASKRVVDAYALDETGPIKVPTRSGLVEVDLDDITHASVMSEPVPS